MAGNSVRKPPDQTIHGGAGAERRLSTGQEFIGAAHDAELAVVAELETDGAVSIYRKRAARLQAASDLYWGAILGCSDTEKLDRFMARWGWLQSSALRAWDRLHALEKEQGKTVDITDIRERYSDDTQDT